MDEQQLQDFLNWLPTRFEEFQNKTPEESVEMLNKLYETDEGKQQIEAMFTAFVSETQQGGPQAAPQQAMFKRGGKLDYFVGKYGKGGKATKKCECGCEIISVHENGGTIERCACGCKTKKSKTKKKLEGGSLIPGSNSKRLANFPRK